MPISKPFHRSCRPFTDGSYHLKGYLLDRRFAHDPQHYVRAFLLVQRDFLELFDYIEPADVNSGVYSHRIQQLLMRTCVEVEANLTAILIENGYKQKENLNMRDYKKIDKTHHLSSYEVRLPGWRGSKNVRTPFVGWKIEPGSLSWYEAYNKSKHDRHKSFHLATFEALIDAIVGLVVLISAQFLDEDYSPMPKSRGLSRNYSYDTDDEMDSALGGYFRIKYPMDWDESEKYEFTWETLNATDPNPFDKHFS